MKHLISVMFSMCLFVSMSGQQVIKEKAQIFADAYVNNQFLKVAEMTHPGIIEMNGGQEFVIQDLKAERNSTTEQGLIYTKAEVQEPEKIIAFDGEIQAVLSVTYYMQVMEKEYTNETSILAVSNDEGKNFTFVNMVQYDLESINFFIKNLSPDLEFPAQSAFNTIEK